jgi:hypothetical protein
MTTLHLYCPYQHLIADPRPPLFLYYPRALLACSDIKNEVLSSSHLTRRLPSPFLVKKEHAQTVVLFLPSPINRALKTCISVNT